MKRERPEGEMEGGDKRREWRKGEWERERKG